jgi:hypothetical protein
MIRAIRRRWLSLARGKCRLLVTVENCLGNFTAQEPGRVKKNALVRENVEAKEVVMISRGFIGIEGIG